MLEDRTTKIAVFAGGGVIALVLVVALVVSMTSKKTPPATTTVAADSPALAQHRRVLKEGIAALSELTDAIAAITDEASAEAAEPKVRAAVEQFQAIADRSSGLARLGKAEKQKFEGEALDEYVQALVKWQAEMKRFRAIPGAPQKLASLAKLVNPPE